ncbi:unnamed protein product [Jaminaea pallidilutea]
MVDRRPTKRSIVDSMGLERKFAPEDPTSPPVWARSPSPTQQRRHRQRLDSNASRNTTATQRKRSSVQGRPYTSSAARSPPPSANQEEEARIRAAGSASKRRSVTSKPPPPAPAPVLQEPSPQEVNANAGSGGGGRFSKFKLFGRGGGKGAAAAPAPASAKAPARELEPEPESEFESEPEPKPSARRQSTQPPAAAPQRQRRTSAAGPPPNANANARRPGPDPSSYADEPSEDNNATKRQSMIMGLGGLGAALRARDRAQTPATDGDTRRKRWNSKAKSQSVITAGLADTTVNSSGLGDEDDDDDDDKSAAPRPMGIGRMSNKQAREKRASMMLAPIHEAGDQPQGADRTRTRTRTRTLSSERPRPVSYSSSKSKSSQARAPTSPEPLPRHQLVDEGVQPVPMARTESKASKASKVSNSKGVNGSLTPKGSSRGASGKRSKNGAPQLPDLPALAGLGGLGSIIKESNQVQPDYADDDEDADAYTDEEFEEPPNLRRPASRIDEEDEEEFVEADDSAFPTAPAVKGPNGSALPTSRSAIREPEPEVEPLVEDEIDEADSLATERPDVLDEEDAASNVIDRKQSVATVGAPLAAQQGVDEEDDEEEEEEIPPYDEATAKSAPAEKIDSKRNGDHGKGALLAGTGLGAAAGAGAAGLLSAGNDRNKASARGGDRSPVIPGGFASEPAASNATASGVQPEDEDDFVDDYDDVPLEQPRRAQRADAAPAAAAAAAAPAAKSQKAKRKPSTKRPKQVTDDDELAATAPLKTRSTSAAPPEKPTKSKNRKPYAAPVPVARQAEPEPELEPEYEDDPEYDAELPEEQEEKPAKDPVAARRSKKAKGAAAAGGGALALGGASALAAKKYKDDDEWADEQPAVLSEGDDDDQDGYGGDDFDDLDGAGYANGRREPERPRDTRAELRQASKAKRKKPSSKAGPAAAATAGAIGASGKPSKRSKGVKNLTPVQRHYLLKALVSLQMQGEWEELEKLGALTQYGFPFSAERPKLTRVKLDLKNEYTTSEEVDEEAEDPYADDSDDARRLENLQEPLILRHLFHIHLMSFPGLDQAPLKFWQKRIQVFFDEMAARNFSTSVERGEYSKRRFYTMAATRYLGGYFARGVGVRGPGELRGPGPGEKGSEKWGVGKKWGKGTVKRGLDRPARIDSNLWKKIDSLFGDGQEGQAWRRAGKETTRVRGDWQAWKEQIVENESGLEETINYLDVSKIRNLPPKYRNAEEWARNHAAYLFHSLFVTTPNADSTYKVLKGVHALFPYWGAKQLLKYANAQVLIEGILNLLLARPAGAKSLIQRIATYVIGSEATTLQKEYIAPLKKAIGDAELTKRIDEYVGRGSRPEGRSVRARAERTGDDVLTVILLSAGGTPLSRDSQDRVLQLQSSFARSPYRGQLEAAYPPGTTFAKENPEKLQVPKWDGGVEDEEEALKFARLKLYLRDSLRKRDREQATKVASGALVPTVIKDFLQTVMYDVIKKIASTADLSGRLGDLQAFIDDLLEVKKRKDDSIEAWVALAARHENSLYYFVHECSSIAGPLFEWCQIGLDYMALSTSDPIHPADRSAKNIEVSLEEMLQDSRLSEKDVELILEEVDELAVYTKWSKVAYELEMRKNFLLSRKDAATNSPLTEDDVPTEEMKEEIRDLDALMRELMESEGVPVDDGSLPNESRGTEARELATFWFDVMDPLGQHLKAERGAPELSYKPLTVTPPVPCLKYIRKAMPVFRETLKDRLPDWQNGDANGPRKPSAAGQDGTRRPKNARAGSNGAANGAPPAKKSGGKGLFGR